MSQVHIATIDCPVSSEMNLLSVRKQADVNKMNGILDQKPK